MRKQDVGSAKILLPIALLGLGDLPTGLGIISGIFYFAATLQAYGTLLSTVLSSISIAVSIIGFIVGMSTYIGERRQPGTIDKLSILKGILINVVLLALAVYLLTTGSYPH